MSPTSPACSSTGAGQPQLDPADNPLFPRQHRRRAPRARRRAAHAGRQSRPSDGPQRLRQPHRRISRPQPTNRAGFDLGPITTARPPGLRPARGRLQPARVPLRRPDTATTICSLNAGYRHLGAGWELYAFGSYGHRNAPQRRQLAPAERRRQPRLGAPAPNQTPNAANFVPLTPDGFLPLIDTELDDYAGTVGLRGELMRLEGRPVRRPRPQQLRL
jgi:iron complex outermembrane receptor protein